ncbi:hypothetical protein GGS24DRAFT_473801 [Hypoxylon argillaceum]|nr:hypothetical protein GGS24DRAFT_473801 [Hypoxylon argillaceum]
MKKFFFFREIVILALRISLSFFFFPSGRSTLVLLILSCARYYCVLRPLLVCGTCTARTVAFVMAAAAGG